MQSILQSQGQVLRKMRFMPSSLTSKSHRLLTALVDSKHKKVFKVKAVITETDPEKEKHEKEKVTALVVPVTSPGNYVRREWLSLCYSFQVNLL